MHERARSLLFLRSAVFLVVFHFVLALFLILSSWLLFAPRRWAMKALLAHAHTSLFLLRIICGTKFQVRGREKLVPGPVIIAAKHQATWDTFALLTLMRDPALVMKAELLRIPIYGWFCEKFGMISIRREQGPSALREMTHEARQRASENREIVIFPEGTRRTPYACPDYKPGVFLLYQALSLNVCPVALNSGVFWPRHSFLRYPGTIVVEILDTIPPDLNRRNFLERLENTIEPVSNRLADEAYAKLVSAGYEQKNLPSYSST